MHSKTQWVEGHKAKATNSGTQWVEANKAQATAQQISMGGGSQSQGYAQHVCVNGPTNKIYTFMSAALLAALLVEGFAEYLSSASFSKAPLAAEAPAQ